uniref:Uncharacterized protein n=1 Tax=Octopus bimaculoides TaxID=37653 RepID=A0A0L8H2P1_OCTBM
MIYLYCNPLSSYMRTGCFQLLQHQINISLLNIFCFTLIIFNFSNFYNLWLFCQTLLDYITIIHISIILFLLILH